MQFSGRFFMNFIQNIQRYLLFFYKIGYTVYNLEV